MMKTIVLLAAALTAYGRQDTAMLEVERWKAVSRVYVPVDEEQLARDMAELGPSVTYADVGRRDPTFGEIELKPVYPRVQGRDGPLIVVYTREDLIPGGMSVVPMGRTQAMDTLQNETDFIGFCLDPAPGGACRVTLDREEMIRLANQVMTASAPNPQIPFSIIRAGDPKPDFLALVPEGWRVERQIDGMLTSSALPDVVLQLTRDDYQFNRGLLILSRAQDGRLQRAALAEKLLTPIGDGIDLQIVKGVLIVSQVNFDERFSRLQRFRYDPPSKQFRLIGEDSVASWRSGRSETASTNFLTGNHLVQKRRYSDQVGKDIVVSTQTSSVERIQKPIEEVQYAAAVPYDVAGTASTVQAGRLLVRTRLFDDRQAGIAAPGRFAAVPRIILDRFEADLRTEVVATRLSLVDPGSPVSDRRFPRDAEFFWLDGVNCVTAECSDTLAWASVSTGTTGLLFEQETTLVPRIGPCCVVVNAEISVLPRSSKGLFDLNIDGGLVEFDGERYVLR